MTTSPGRVDTEIGKQRDGNEKDRLRFVRNLRFVKKTDDLDSSIHSILEYCLDQPLSDSDKLMSSEEADDIVEQLPSLENVLNP